MVEQYTDTDFELLVQKFERLKRAYVDLERRIAEFEERFNRYYPDQLNCPKCGRKATHNMTKCKFCSTPLGDTNE